VAEAHWLLAKSGLLSKLTPIAPRSATKEELTSFHSVEYIEKLRMLSEGNGGEAGVFAVVVMSEMSPSAEPSDNSGHDGVQDGTMIIPESNNNSSK
jgi:acetoin utilization deacetylase AcuC-like enzyme